MPIAKVLESRECIEMEKREMTQMSLDLQAASSIFVIRIAMLPNQIVPFPEKRVIDCRLERSSRARGSIGHVPYEEKQIQRASWHTCEICPEAVSPSAALQARR